MNRLLERPEEVSFRRKAAHTIIASVLGIGLCAGAGKVLAEIIPSPKTDYKPGPRVPVAGDLWGTVQSYCPGIDHIGGAVSWIKEMNGIEDSASIPFGSTVIVPNVCIDPTQDETIVSFDDIATLVETARSEQHG